MNFPPPTSPPQLIYLYKEYFLLSVNLHMLQMSISHAFDIDADDIRILMAI